MARKKQPPATQRRALTAREQEQHDRIAELLGELESFKTSSAHFAKLFYRHRDRADLAEKALRLLTSSTRSACAMADAILETADLPDEDTPF